MIFHEKMSFLFHSHQPDSLEMYFSNQPDNLDYLFSLKRKVYPATCFELTPKG